MSPDHERILPALEQGVAGRSEKPHKARKCAGLYNSAGASYQFAVEMLWKTGFTVP